MPKAKKIKTDEEARVQIINSLTVKKWRQFEHVELVFHPKVSVLVGANGTGKTSILNILASAFRTPTVGHEGFISTPHKSDLGNTSWRPNNLGKFKILPTQQIQFGSIRVNNGALHAMTSGTQFSRVINVAATKQETVAGVHISSYRTPVISSNTSTRRGSIGKPDHVLHEYLTEYKKLSTGHIDAKSFVHPWTLIKDWIYKLATTANTTEFCQGDDGNRKILVNFISVLKKVLPLNIGFVGLETRGNNIVVKTTTSEFNFDALSDGLGTLVSICFQVYLCSLCSSEFVVTFDEPENHLHVQMQRRLLPDLQLAFPTAQFIVATHSPVIVNSIEDSKVFVLRWNSRDRVESSELNELVKSGTANDILREVLGVDTALPIWAASRLENIVNEYAKKPVSIENMQLLKLELEKAGLDQYAPKAAVHLIEKSDD